MQITIPCDSPMECISPGHLVGGLVLTFQAQAGTWRKEKRPCIKNEDLVEVQQPLVKGIGLLCQSDDLTLMLVAG